MRSLSSLFGRFSSVPVRGRFSRLREIMLVLTSDSVSSNGSGGGSALADNFTQLTASEVDAFMVLRVDSGSFGRS